MARLGYKIVKIEDRIVWAFGLDSQGLLNLKIHDILNALLLSANVY